MFTIKFMAKKICITIKHSTTICSSSASSVVRVSKLEHRCEKTANDQDF